MRNMASLTFPAWRLKPRLLTKTPPSWGSRLWKMGLLHERLPAGSREARNEL